MLIDKRMFNDNLPWESTQHLNVQMYSLVAPVHRDGCCFERRSENVYVRISCIETIYRGELPCFISQICVPDEFIDLYVC